MNMFTSFINLISGTVLMIAGFIWCCNVAIGIYKTEGLITEEYNLVQV
jgi:hypothetical protein